MITDPQAETISQLRAEVALLRDALNTFGRHHPTCNRNRINTPSVPCICGLSEALASPSCGNGSPGAHEWKPVTGAHGIEGYGEKEDPDGL